MAVPLPEPLKAVLDGKNFAHLTTLDPDGTPQATAMWVTRDGDRRLIAWSNTCITDQDGKVAYVIGTGVDITEQQQAEEALRESEERFRQAITSISDHIYMTEVTEDGTHINLYISPNVESLTGYPLEKFMADRYFWRFDLITGVGVL